MNARPIALALLALLAACQRAPDDASQSAGPAVNPRDYSAYYVWPGVRPPEGAQPKVLYLLDGEVRRGGAARFVRLRPGTPRLPGKTVWLVVRIDRLDLTDAAWTAILADLARWQEAGNTVAGLQIDFDAATNGIGNYARFLDQVRHRLPTKWRLSITGLMDWSAHGDPQALAALGGVIDEVVVQTYQGRTTIPGYEAYFARMENFPIPFRVALVDGGAWQAPAMLARQKQFRGYVVFLLRH